MADLKACPLCGVLPERETMVDNNLSYRDGGYPITIMKHRTKVLGIPRAVKQAVAERDSHNGHPCCILCGTPAPTSDPLAFSNAHYISRAHGGLGIEENILTLCPRCHRQYDGQRREALRSILRRYLREKYENWTENELTYQKGG